MNFLLDTHVLIWWLENNSKLPDYARAWISKTPEVYISSVSIWELVIKVSAKKLKLNMNVLCAEILRHQFRELPISHKHAIQVLQLPTAHHHDPFDRMLVAQAMSEPLTLLTADHALAGYSSQVQLI